VKGLVYGFGGGECLGDVGSEEYEVRSFLMVLRKLWWNRSTWQISCDALAGLLPMVRLFPGALPQADMLPAFQALRSRCNVALLHHDLRRCFLIGRVVFAADAFAEVFTAIFRAKVVDFEVVRVLHGFPALCLGRTRTVQV